MCLDYDKKSNDNNEHEDVENVCVHMLNLQQYWMKKIKW